MTTIVVDGISASGKTTLMAALQQRMLDTRRNYSKLVLSEHLTERWLEGGAPDSAAVEAHVARLLRLAADLQQLYSDGPFAGTPQVLSVLIERLFLTLITRGLLAPDFAARQAPLIERVRLHGVLLVVPPAEIEERIAGSLEHRNPKWAEYIASLGGTRSAVDHFALQQQRMIAASDDLRRYMPTQVIEVTGVEVLVASSTLEALLP